jgi:hypothetical protein
MTDLHDIQRQLVERIGTAPVGSALRFRLMDAADAVSRAIEAEAKARGAESSVSDDGNHPETQQSRAASGGAQLEGNQS